MSKFIYKYGLIILFLTLGSRILLAQDSAEVVILSPKVGSVIDSAEREHYHLFRAVENFSSAVLVRMPDGKFYERITTRDILGREPISMEISEALIYSLAERIENYEEIEDGTYVWGTNRPSIQIGAKKVECRPELQATQIPSGEEKQYRENVKIVITTQSGDQYSGKVLFVTDSVLMIWKSIEPYDSSKLNDFAVSLSFFEIERIVVEKEGKFWSGMGTGLLCGGAVGAVIGLASGDDKKGLIFSFSAGEKAGILGVVLGICGASVGGAIGAAQGTNDEFIIGGDSEKYKVVMTYLKRYAVFPFMPPPKLQAFLVQKKEESAPPEPSTTRFHLSVGGSWIMTSANITPPFRIPMYPYFIFGYSISTYSNSLSDFEKSFDAIEKMYQQQGYSIPKHSKLEIGPIHWLTCGLSLSSHFDILVAAGKSSSDGLVLIYSDLFYRYSIHQSSKVVSLLIGGGIASFDLEVQRSYNQTRISPFTNGTFSYLDHVTIHAQCLGFNILYGVELNFDFLGIAFYGSYFQFPDISTTINENERMTTNTSGSLVGLRIAIYY